MDINLKWFDTFEEREAYFQAHISGLIPPSHLGAKRFWQAFAAVAAKDVTAYNQRRIACITAFPLDSLAFASPLQVLRAAVMGQPDALAREQQAVEIFKLGPLLGQALRTLSGGETVRLALAKTWLNAPTHTRLAVASPYSWLDSHNAELTETAARAYLTQNKPVDFLALHGENADMAAGTFTTSAPPCLTPLSFNITARDLRLKLSQSLSLGTPPLWADAGSFDLTLASPCLVSGVNGAGKSLLVKALTKVGAYRGSLTVTSANNNAPCRLIMQNTLSQSLLRVKNQFAPVSSGALRDEFNQLRQTLRQTAAGFTGTGISAESLLDIKLALAAARLCQNPKLLILDEPEWGLSLTDALAFVYTLCETAHVKGVPVMLVSHKNWWRGLAQSGLNVCKSNLTGNAAKHTAFSMQIKAAQI